MVSELITSLMSILYLQLVIELTILPKKISSLACQLEFDTSNFTMIIIIATIIAAFPIL